MPDAGYKPVVSVSINDGTYNIISGCNSITMTSGQEVLESTDFTDPAKDRIGGLRDASYTLSGDYDHSDTAQAAIRDALLAGAYIWIQVRWTGSGGTGHNFAGAVESFDVSVDVEGKATFSCTLSAIETLTTAMSTEA